MKITDIFNKVPTNGGWWNDKFGDTWKRQIDLVKSKFGASIEEVRDPFTYPTDVPIIYVKKDSLVRVLEFLKTDPEFKYIYLADYTATDEEKEPRFELVLNL